MTKSKFPEYTKTPEWQLQEFLKLRDGWLEKGRGRKLLDWEKRRLEQVEKSIKALQDQLK